VDNGQLARFRHELQHLLACWTWRIRFSDFLNLYRLRYARDIDLKGFGVENLESLFQKVFIFICSLFKHIGFFLTYLTV
jgi:hypothetical protein